MGLYCASCPYNWFCCWPHHLGLIEFTASKRDLYCDLDFNLASFRSKQKVKKFLFIFLIIILYGGFFYYSNLVLAEKIRDNQGQQQEEVGSNNGQTEKNGNSQNQESSGEEGEIEDKVLEIPEVLEMQGLLAAPGNPEIEEGDLVINEFMANPSEGENEWIEIFNKTDRDIDLNLCIIKDKANNHFGSFSDSNSTISVGGYVVLEDINILNNTGIEIITLTCGYEIDKVEYNSVSSDTKRPTIPKNKGESLARIPNGKDTDNDKEDFQIIEKPTPGESNTRKENHAPVAKAGSDQEVFVGEEAVFSGEESNDEDGDDLIFSWDFGDGAIGSGEEVSHTYTNAGTYTVTLIVSDGELENSDTLTIKVNKIVYSDKILINEFLPDPEGDDAAGEFIELYNSGDSDVDLKNWKIGDNTIKRYVFLSDTIIEAGNYKVVYYSASRIVLNNTSDVVRLFQPDGNLLEEVKYDKSKTGFSYNRINGDWKWSSKLTPGAKNIIEELEDEEEEKLEEETKKLSISDAKKQEKGTKVKIEGIVSVPPGVFSDKIFYLSGSGIQIYCYYGFPDLKIGDKVSVIGTLSEYYNELRIKMTGDSDINILGGEKEPEPHKIKTGEVNEDLEGSLVEVGGTITRSAGSSFYINDGSGETRIYIDKDTGIVKPTTKKGDYVSIIGVVSETSVGYRVLPRFQSDLKIVKAASTKAKSTSKKKLAATGGNIFEPILMGFLLSLFALRFKNPF